MKSFVLVLASVLLLPTPSLHAAPTAPAIRGKLTKHRFTTSKVFPGTERDYWVYVPAEYAPATPACLMVFQDGGGYAELTGPWKVPVVFDRLIADKGMPVTVGVFVNPGVVPATAAKALPRQNRSFEYDELGDRYARFLLDELLPEVGRTVNLSREPGCRAIAGASSGAIAAFNAAWERPQSFGRIFSTIGTYVGLRGGDELSTLVRKTEPKPLRVFLQDGRNDLDIFAGSWWVANQQMLSALTFAGYQVNHVWGEGKHNDEHGAAILPEALVWLWKGFPEPITAGKDSKQPVVKIVDPAVPWTLVGEGYGFAEGPESNARGEVFFADIPGNRILKAALDGRVVPFVEPSGGTAGLMFGKDGRLYATQMKEKAVVSFDRAGKSLPVVKDLEPNDLAVSHEGHVYVTEPSTKRVWFIARRKDGGFEEKRSIDTTLGYANGILLTPDQTQLYVSDSRGRYVWIFQRRSDGSLTHPQPHCHLHLKANASESGADGMTVDIEGRLYVATRMGLQICDQLGRVLAIVPMPESQSATNVVFGGPAHDELIVTTPHAVYRRKTRTRGVHSWQPPLVPEKPRL
jgi:sugar lactone lactonase YvrE/poly(3-hydroxybutyrate) depolymerase